MKKRKKVRERKRDGAEEEGELARRINKIHFRFSPPPTVTVHTCRLPREAVFGWFYTIAVSKEA